MIKPIGKALTLTALSIVLALGSCDKPLIEADNDNEQKVTPTTDEGTTTTDDHNTTYDVKFKVAAINQLDFSYSKTKVVEEISRACSHIDLAVYDLKGNLAKPVVNQSALQTDFGQFSLELKAGKYLVVAVAHSDTAAATMSNINSIKFTKKELSDVFYYYDTITVDSNRTYDMMMKRAVAMIRFTVKDATPSKVTNMFFSVPKGLSHTLDAQTGLGKSNGYYVETPVNEAKRNGGAVYELYAFPTEESQSVKMIIRPMAGTIFVSAYEKVMEGIPVTRNKITDINKNYFSADPQPQPNPQPADTTATDTARQETKSNSTFHFMADTEWGSQSYQ